MPRAGSSGQCYKLGTLAAVVSGSNCQIIIPPTYSGAATSVVYYCHGAGETARDLTGDPNHTGIIAGMMQAGYIVAASDAAGDNWGNAAGQAAMVALDGYVTTNFNVTKSAILGESMGGLCGLSLIAAGTIANCLGFYGIYPVCSLSTLFASNAGPFSPAIRTAYGIAANGSDYSSKTSGFDPLLVSAASFATRLRFTASASDVTVGKTANSDAMSAHCTSATEASVVTCSRLHGDLSHFQSADLVSFLGRCFA